MSTSETLTINLHGRPVAHLQSGPRLALRYTPQAASEFGEGGLCLSVSLPVTADTYKDPPRSSATVGRRRPVQFWCEGLLPEGEARTSLENRFKILRGDTFGLLAAIGADCAGAVSFTRPGQPLPLPQDPAVVLSTDDVAAAIAELPNRPLGADDISRVSLGGLQAKLLLTQTPQGWTVPTFDAPSTHIFKPDPTGLRQRGLVVVEAICLRAAQRLGISSAEVELLDVEGRTVLQVKRFDREVVDGTIRRLHQEDGCQALGIEPTGESKYQHLEPGPPSYRAIAEVLRTHALNADAELMALARQMIFGWAVGNTDGHARNYSVLVSRTVSLAPMYDVTFTAPFSANRKHGLWIGGQQLLPYISAAHLLREMVVWGISDERARLLMNDVLADLPNAVDAAAEDLETFIDNALLTDLRDQVSAAYVQLKTL